MFVCKVVGHRFEQWQGGAQRFENGDQRTPDLFCARCAFPRTYVIEFEALEVDLPKVSAA